MAEEAKKKTIKKAEPKAAKVAAPKKAEKKAEVKVESKKMAPKTASKGLTVDVLGKDGKKGSTMTLPADIFGAKVNPVLMAQAVRVYLANQRQGNANTKTRSEISGTTKKVWQQKGTGRARHGSRKGPVFVGGGIVHGPETHGFSMQMPQKARRAALASALTVQLADSKVMFVDGLESEAKTKTVATFLKNAQLSNMKKVRKVLLVTGDQPESVRRAARNIEGVTVTPANCLNTYEVLNSHTVLFTKSAIGSLQSSIFKGGRKE